MGRAPCCDKASVKKGPWSPEEDLKLKEFIEKNGTGGNWIALPHKAGLKRCGKSCRLRWLNYLRPNIKHGEFSDDEDRIIYSLFATIGSRWSIIAAQLPGRTDNDIKNYWNTKLKKKLMGLIPSSHHHHIQLKKPPTQPSHFSSSSSSSSHLQTSSSISFNGTTSYNPTRSSSLSSTSFMGFLTEHMSKLSSNHHLINNNTSTNTLLQAQENSLGPIQNYQVVKDNMFMFGAGDQPSCSSSDGSCNHISYGKESNIHEFHDHYGGNGGSVCDGTYINGGHDQQMVLEMNGFAEENQKFVLSSNGCDHHGWSTDHQKQNGSWGNHHHLQYGQNIHNHQQSAHGYASVDVEEVKQVIVTASNNNNFLFSSDENKTQGGGGGGGGGGKEVMYYY